MTYFVPLVCCHTGCGSTWAFSQELDAYLRRTHESFFCPKNRHQQSYAGETECEKKAREALAAKAGAEKRLQYERQSSQRTYDMYKRENEAKKRARSSLVAELKKRGRGVYRTGLGWSWVSSCNRASTADFKTEAKARAFLGGHEKRHKCGAA